MATEILKDEEQSPTLHMIESPKGVELATPRTFGQSGELSLGRGSGNDWILKDEQRILSVRHCRVFSEGHNCFLVDSSTNGTFLNDAQTPLGRGVMAILADGDRIRLGRYCFAIKIAHAEREVETAGDEKERTSDRIETDLMMQFTPTELELLGPEFAGFQLEEPVNLYDPGGAADSALKQTGTPSEANPFFIQRGFGQRHSKLHSTEALAAEPGNEAWLEPQVKQNARQEVAADWDETALACGEPQVSRQDLPESAPVKGSITPFARPASPARAASQKHKKTTAQPGDGGVGADALLLRGLNADIAAMTPSRVAEVKKKLVILVRETLTGVQRLIRLRNKTRKTLRLNVTTIGSKNNNPFQFSASVDELLRNLLMSETPGYIDPIEALRETFAGLADHEAALLVGFQASQRALLKKLDPTALVATLAEAPTGVFNRSTAKHRFLQAYRIRYQEVARDIERLPHGFDPEFIDAYEKTIAKLAERHAK